MVDCIIITGHISHSYYSPSSAMSAGISFWQQSESESEIVLGTKGNPIYVFSLHIMVCEHLQQRTKTKNPPKQNKKRGHLLSCTI